MKRIFILLIGIVLAGSSQAQKWGRRHPVVYAHPRVHVGVAIGAYPGWYGPVYPGPYYPDRVSIHVSGPFFPCGESIYHVLPTISGRYSRSEYLRSAIPAGIRDNNGCWKISIPLLPSGEYRYKFIIDDRMDVEDVDNPLREPDGYIGWLSILKVEN